MLSSPLCLSSLALLWQRRPQGVGDTKQGQQGDTKSHPVHRGRENGAHFLEKGTFWGPQSSLSIPLALGLSPSMEQPHPSFPATEKPSVLLGLLTGRSQVD